MKRLNFLQKYALKYSDKAAYQSYKSEMEEYGRGHVFEQFARLPLRMVKKDFYHFKHSGNAGDIIYALPTMQGLSGTAPFDLHLQLNQPNNFEKHITHPLGSVMLNTKMFEMLRPLLLHQPYLHNCLIYEQQPVDYDLDEFRRYPLILDRGNIARWYMLIYPVAYDLNNTWIEAPKQSGLEDAIVIARSSRYNAPAISYRFLSKYSKVFFVGVEEEYKAMQQQIPKLQFLPVNNFLEMAGYIAGSRLFIGNQSFPFSIAEAMKVNRLLEMYYRQPNVNVYGDQGFDFLFQPQFEYLVKMRYEES